MTAPTARGRSSGALRSHISAIVPTYNESASIRACLQSVSFADEILVVDSFSTDDTVAIARELGARVVQREYGYSAQQKNWAIPQAAHEWILLVDADERVTPELKEEILGVMRDGPTADGYWIRRYEVPKNEAAARRELIDQLTKRVFHHTEPGINTPGHNLNDARHAFENETQPARKRVNAAMLAGALLNRGSDIFTMIFELNKRGIEITTCPHT